MATRRLVLIWNMWYHNQHIYMRKYTCVKMTIGVVYCESHVGYLNLLQACTHAHTHTRVQQHKLINTLMCTCDHFFVHKNMQAYITTHKYMLRNTIPVLGELLVSPCGLELKPCSCISSDTCSP